MKNFTERIIVRSLQITAFASLLAGTMHAAPPVTIQFSIENEGQQGGLWIMRPWIGLHDGTFQTFTVGQPASSGVQHIAEDGVTGDPNSALLSGPPNGCTGAPSVYTASPCQFQIFSVFAGGSQQASIGGPTIPGATLVKTFTVDPSDPKSKYLSYLVMIIPSNDAFFGTDSAHPIQLFDNQGRFNGGRGPIHFQVQFNDILDAGTEVNTENHTDTAFFGQAVNGAGTHPDTNPVIHVHDRFSSSIVNGFNMYPASQLNLFNRANTHGSIAEVTISQLP
jgi:hypothetical protein